jgi:hypothetical protein
MPRDDTSAATHLQAMLEMVKKMDSDGIGDVEFETTDEDDEP